MSKSLQLNYDIYKLCKQVMAFYKKILLTQAPTRTVLPHVRALEVPTST